MSDSGPPNAGGELVPELTPEGLIPRPFTHEESLEADRQIAEIEAAHIAKEYGAVGPWEAPLPVVEMVSGSPYPTHALPPKIRAAVIEVQGFVQSPIALVASSALGVVSTVVQGLADVQRTEGLSGPISLFLLSIAVSGERKSFGDDQFLKPLMALVSALLEEMKEEIRENRDEIEIWENQRAGVLAATKQARKVGDKNGEKVQALKLEMAKLRDEEPAKVIAPAPVVVNETTESLQWKLKNGYPSLGFMTSEAGIYFGGHSMKAEQATQNMAVQNRLWDGGHLSVGRRTSESFEAHGVRLTLSLQLQPSVLREFLTQGGGLARDIGFLARFLFSYPASNVGHRAFKPAPEVWTALDAFNSRIASLFALPMPIGDSPRLEPEVIKLNPEAEARWIEYTNSVEAQLRPQGELTEIQDIASKIGDNAARLAGVFHVFEHGVTEVCLSCFDSGAELASWHLDEALRYAIGGGVSPEDIAAQKLDEWIINHCNAAGTDRVAKRYIRQNGPRKIRDAEKLAKAIDRLAELERIRVVKDGKADIVTVNPQLLEAGK
jgi:hypothetical protein